MIAVDVPTITNAPPIYQHLYTVFTHDPMTLLTLAGCWVTPFEDDEVIDDESIQNGWRYIKDLFPDIALGLSWAVWEGCDDATIDHQFVKEINLRVPGAFYDADMIPYGPDFLFLGMDWQDEDLPKKYIPYGKLLNQIDYQRNPYHSRTLTHLTDTLWVERPGIGAFTMWLCGWSGNTLVDMTYDEYAENGYSSPFEWTRDDLDYAWAMQIEAETFFALSREGEKSLNNLETYIQFCETLLKSSSHAIAEVHHVIPESSSS